MARAAEERSRAECERLRTLVETTRSAGLGVFVINHEDVIGETPALAATEARYFDLSLVPWIAEAVATQDLAQSLVFGSGLPVLVPSTAASGTVNHIAIAWDEFRVAARPLGDALPILPLGDESWS